MREGRTSRVKNLAIALEAISRINNEGSGRLYESIEQVLEKELNELIKEQYPLHEAPQATDDILF